MPQIFDHPEKILIVGRSGAGKTNVLLNLIKQQRDDDYNVIDKIYLYIKDPNEAKDQYPITRHEKIGLIEREDSKASIENSSNMLDFYKNIEEYNPDRTCKVLIISFMIRSVAKNLIKS